jgi:putative glutamine transport system permease protein
MYGLMEIWNDIAALIQPENLAFLGRGLWLTFLISAGSIACSLFFGIILGVARSAGKGVFAKLAGTYVEVVRNIPNLLFILAVRIMLPLPPLQLGIVAFTIFTSAAFAEIIRGGLNSIGKGQWEAARSQGFSYITTLIHIILPQAFRNMIPPIVSQCVTVIKDTSYLWAVGIEELTGKGMIIMGQYGSEAQVFLLFTILAATYFLLNYTLSVLARKQQHRMRHQAQAH